MTVVAPTFPETGVILFNKRDFADEFGGLPCIELRDHQSRGTAVLNRKRCSIQFTGKNDIRRQGVINRDVCSVIVRAMAYYKTRSLSGENNVCKSLELHASPAYIEFAPGRNAVEIGDLLDLRQPAEFRPGPGPWVGDFAFHRKGPGSRIEGRMDPQVKNRETCGKGLAWRQTVATLARRLRSMQRDEFFLGGQDLLSHMIGIRQESFRTATS